MPGCPAEAHQPQWDFFVTCIILHLLLVHTSTAEIRARLHGTVGHCGSVELLKEKTLAFLAILGCHFGEKLPRQYPAKNCSGEKLRSIDCYVSSCNITLPSVCKNVRTQSFPHEGPTSIWYFVFNVLRVHILWFLPGAAKFNQRKQNKLISSDKFCECPLNAWATIAFAARRSFSQGRWSWVMWWVM